MKKILLNFALIFCLLFTVSCGQQASLGAQSSLSGSQDAKQIKVISDKANVKTGCSTGTPTVSTLNRDSIANVLGKVADWYAVKLPDNTIGFVPENQCKPVVVEPSTPQTTTGTGTITTPGGTGNTATSPVNPGAQTNANAVSLTAEEQQMLNLVNQARSQNGAQALQVDAKLLNTARLKSQDMINNNYFSHNSPTYGSPFDMMKNFGVNYIKAGENIAGNQSVQAAHNALMNSPGHRKNILDSDFTHVGIGIKRGGAYGLMFTQQFISKPQ